jgi:hypothetical protein
VGGDDSLLFCSLLILTEQGGSVTPVRSPTIDFDDWWMHVIYLENLPYEVTAGDLIGPPVPCTHDDLIVIGGHQDLQGRDIDWSLQLEVALCKHQQQNYVLLD